MTHDDEPTPPHAFFAPLGAGSDSGEWHPLGSVPLTPQTDADGDTDTCWPTHINGATIVVRSTHPPAPHLREALEALVEAAKRRFEAEPPNPRRIAIDALAERLPNVPLRRRVAAANAVLRALDAAGMLTVTLDGLARATDDGLTVPIAATADGVLISPTDQPTHTLTIGMPRERAEALITAAEDTGQDIAVSVEIGGVPLAEPVTMVNERPDETPVDTDPEARHNTVEIYINEQHEPIARINLGEQP